MKKIIITLISLNIIFCLNSFARDPEDSKFDDRIINIDYLRVKGPLNTMFKQCIGAGRANEGLGTDWQQQLIYAKEQCGFKYIRMHVQLPLATKPYSGGMETSPSQKTGGNGMISFIILSCILRIDNGEDEVNTQYFEAWKEPNLKNILMFIDIT